MSTPSGPKMYQAKSIQGGWAQRDPPYMTLLKVAEADIRESKLLDVEYEGIRVGTAMGGKGPSETERQRMAFNREIEAAKKLGEEMFTDGRTTEEGSSHRPPSAKRNPNKKTSDNHQIKKSTCHQPTNQPILNREHQPNLYVHAYVCPCQLDRNRNLELL